MNWKQELMGVKIFVDKNCFTEKVKYRAVAVAVDVNRPNKVKPLFKRKRFVTRTPRAYMVKGVGLIVHPEIYQKIQRQMSDSILKQEREALASVFGVPNFFNYPSNLTLSNIEEALRRIKDAGKQ
jgi:hypothetical protein